MLDPTTAQNTTWVVWFCFFCTTNHTEGCWNGTCLQPIQMFFVTQKICITPHHILIHTAPFCGSIMLYCEFWWLKATYKETNRLQSYIICVLQLIMRFLTLIYPLALYITQFAVLGISFDLCYSPTAPLNLSSDVWGRKPELRFTHTNLELSTPGAVQQFLQRRIATEEVKILFQDPGGL